MLNIYHIAKKEVWDEAKKIGIYQGESFASDGFIHACSFAQIRGVLQKWFQDQHNLMLIEINPDLLDAKVRYENLEGGTIQFPHIYGPINLNSVVNETAIDSSWSVSIKRKQISIENLVIQPHTQFDKQWFLLCSGDFEKKDFNCMTISWGGLGTIWNLPLALVVVRHSRYTFQYIEKYDSFTLSAFNDQYQEILDVLGKQSGRDMDKINQSGLTPVASQIIKAPSFGEAELVLECRKIYSNDIHAAHFLDASIWQHYENHDFHREYFGKVEGIFGIDKYFH